MSVTMSVKGVQNPVRQGCANLRQPSIGTHGFAGANRDIQPATRPVDDTIISSGKLLFFDGKLSNTTRIGFLNHPQQVGGFDSLPGAAFAPLSAYLQGHTSFSDLTEKRLWITFESGVMHRLGLAQMCPVCVSTSSVEVPKGLRRDVMTMTALLRIKDVQSRLSVPRSTVYELIDKGELERVYIASAPRIVDDSVEAYIDRLRVPGRMTVRQGTSR